MKKYPIYQVTVYDHASFLDRYDIADSTIDFFGVIFKEDKTYYYMSSCVFDRNIECDQNDCHTVMKSSVIKKRKLGEIQCQKKPEKTQNKVKV